MGYRRAFSWAMLHAGDMRRSEEAFEETTSMGMSAAVESDILDTIGGCCRVCGDVCLLVPSLSVALKVSTEPTLEDNFIWTQSLAILGTSPVSRNSLSLWSFGMIRWSGRQCENAYGPNHTAFCDAACGPSATKTIQQDSGG